MTHPRHPLQDALEALEFISDGQYDVDWPDGHREARASCSGKAERVIPAIRAHIAASARPAQGSPLDEAVKALEAISSQAVCAGMDGPEGDVRMLLHINDLAEKALASLRALLAGGKMPDLDGDAVRLALLFKSEDKKSEELFFPRMKEMLQKYYAAGLAAGGKDEAMDKDEEIARLKAQLPEEMQDCTIIAKQCPKGHTWLTAKNWVQLPCWKCDMDALERDNKRLFKEHGIAMRLLQENTALLNEQAITLAELRASTPTPQQQADMVMVPLEPTIAMRRAAWDWENGYGENRISPARCVEIYKAMLAAARKDGA